jgi:dihydroorotase
VPLCVDRLVHAGLISMSRLVELLSTNPARVMRLPGGTLTDGRPADITILAPDAPVTVRASSFRSKGRNTPFEGWSLKGAVAATIVGGRAVYVNEGVLGRKAL